MFLDIDFPEEPRTPALFGWLKRKLTGRQPPSVEELVEPSFERLRTWLATRPDWSARVYRTRAGLRYVFTHDVFDPVGREAHEAMAFLGADERYRKLCRVQQSFRARLTPKPWRIGVSLPPAKYPYESTRDEQRMQEWQATYASAGKDYAVCELVSTLGADRTHPEVELIRAIHDETTRVGSGLPLA